MYEPTTIAYIAIAAVSAYSTYSQGQAGKKQASANAAIAEADADAAKKKAAYDEQMHRERVKRILSSQRAAIGKAGISLEGSPLLAIEETERQGELDALAIRRGGDVQAARFRSEAVLSRMKGRAAAKEGTWGAGTTLLTSGYKYAAGTA